MMATVYRLETKNHTGVYYAGGAFRDCDDDDMRDKFGGIAGNSRPTPQCDPGINRACLRGHENCAFTSIEQLFRWFSPKDVLAIEGTNTVHGYVRLVKIENVCIAATGERQCLFTPPRDYQGNIKESCYHVLHKSEIQELAGVYLQHRDILSRVPAL